MTIPYNMEIMGVDRPDRTYDDREEVDKSKPLKLPPKDLVHLHLQGWTAIQNLRQSQVHELKRDLPANKKEWNKHPKSSRYISVEMK